MMAQVLINDRMPKYLENGGAAERVREDLIRMYERSQVLSETSRGEMSIVKHVEKVQGMKPILTNLFHIIIFFMVFLSIIMNHSLVQSDVDERRYEFAMLRTLGYRKNQLVQLLFAQTGFFSVPAFIFGMLLMLILLVGIKLAIYSLMRFPIETYIDLYTICMAIALGLVIPQLSNLSPIRSVMASSLRDSLDINRRGRPD